MCTCSASGNQSGVSYETHFLINKEIPPQNYRACIGRDEGITPSQASCCMRGFVGLCISLCIGVNCPSFGRTVLLLDALSFCTSFGFSQYFELL